MTLEALPSHASACASPAPVAPPPLPLPLPARAYTDEKLYRKVLERVFFRSWLYACHASFLEGAGRYKVVELLGESLLLVRDQSNVLHAFYNVCQHRGHRIASDEGNATRFVCPYHAWCYDLQGRLKSAPGTKGVRGFDKDKVHLARVRVEEFLGFVFVNFDRQAASMEQTYPNLAATLERLCPDIAARYFAFEHSAQEESNWLVAVENYNECYHCQHVHKAFSEGVVVPESYDVQPLGCDARVLHHSAKAATGEGSWYDTSRSDYASFFLYPGFSFQLYPSGLLNTYYWRPLSVSTTRVHRGWFSHDGSVNAELEAIIERDRTTTFAEDLELVKSVQRGLESRSFEQAQLVVSTQGGVKSEHSLACLHRWLREDVAEAGL